MRALSLTLVTALCGMLPGCAGAQVEGDVRGPLSRLIPFWSSDSATEETPPPAAPRTTQALQDMRAGYRNASFEQLRTSWEPADWTRVREPSVAPGDAFAGTRSALVSASHHFVQDLSLSLPAWQTVTFGAMGRAELGVEQPRVDLYTMSSGATTFVTETTARDEPFGTAYAPFYATMTRQYPRTGETVFRTRIQSRTEVDWVRYDDVFIVLEEIANGDFENTSAVGSERLAWAFDGGARLTEAETPLAGTRSLWMPPGTSARQFVAHTPYEVTYFLSGRASGAFDLEETRFTTTGAVADGTTSRTVTVPLSGEFFLELPRSNDARAARLILSNRGESTVVLDDVSRGWSYIWPKVFAPEANSGSPTVRLAAAWPGRLSSAAITIENEEGSDVLTIANAQRDGTSVWVDFDGGALPAGSYTARFDLAAADGMAVTTRKPFALERPAPFPSQPSVAQFDDFIRMPWMWFYPFTAEQEIDSVEVAEARLRAAKDEGYNFLFLILAEEQYPIFREATERVGLPFMIYNPLLSPQVRADVAHRTYDPSLFMDELSQFEIFADSPLFQGIYIYDEPNVVGRPTVDRVVQLSALMEADGRWPPGYAFMNPNRSVAGSTLPIVSTFNYPFFRQPQTNKSAFEAYVAGTEEEIGFAIAEDRPFWAGTQAYGSILGDPPMSPAQASAQLGLAVAMGSSGYFAFMYTSLNSISGLRDHQFLPGRRLGVYTAFNERMELLWPSIRDLSRDRTAPEESQNVIARMAQDSAGDYTVFVVNYDDERATSVTITALAQTTMTDVEHEIPDEEGTQFALELLPGAWKVVRYSGGVKPQSFMGVYQEIAAPEAVAPVRELNRFTLPGRTGSIALNPTSGTLAARVGDNFMVFDFAGNKLFDEYGSANPGSVGYLGPDKFYGVGRRWGIRIFEHQNGAVTRTFERERHTGGSLALLPDGEDKLWSALSFRGVAHLDVSDDYDYLGFYPADNYDYYSLHGPFGSGSVVGVEHVSGLFRHEQVGDELLRERLSQSGLYARGVSSPSGRRIATGNVDRGVAVYFMTPEGRVAKEAHITDPKLIDAEGTGWLGEGTLAVIDLKRCIRFYRVMENGEWSALGKWVPGAEPLLIDSIATLPGEGLLAVSLYNAELVIADVRGVAKEDDGAGGWVLY